ncbi:MAG: MFS transporter [Candidatus Dormibacteraceae bacterium]
MPTAPSAVDQGFLRRVTIATAFGEGLDGYDLGEISVVLALLIAPELHMSPIWTGLIGSSSLLGIFLGGPIFGWFTDRFGRRRLFTADLVVFIVASLLQFLVQSDWQLFVVRIVLGLAIGAECSVGAPILSEFVPRSRRGNRLATLEVCWYLGYLASVVAAYALILIPGIGWRLVLASSAVPALVTLLLRMGMPESPRWLMSQGREPEARAIIDRYLGGEASFQGEDYAGELQETQANFVRLFSRQYLSRTLFLCIFWSCLVAPYFAIFTFANEVLKDMRLSNPVAGQIAINGVAAVGCITGMLVVERIGRRTLLIGTFWISAIALAVTIWSGLPGWGTVLAFMVFSFFNASAAVLCAIYPNELFPTELRGSGAGIGSAASRVGAAVGTFLLPVGLSTIGIGPSMAIGAAILVLGAVVSHLWAPETTGQTLTVASGVRRAGPGTMTVPVGR